MSNWNKIKLKDVTTKIGSGATPRGGKNSYQISGIPLIRSLNVYDLFFEYKDLAFINNEQAKKLNNVEVKKGDVLINITGASVCRTTSAPDNLIPARVNQHVSIIRADNKELFGGFLKYLLVSPKYKGLLLNIAGTGATREALTKEDLENFEIKVPAYSLQKKIASIFSAYDDLIEVNNKRIKILEEMAQLIYKEWFVNFKFPGHERVKINNGVPKGWEEMQVGEALKRVQSGKKYDNKTASPKGIVPILDQGRSGIIGFHDNEPGVIASEEEPIIVFANHTCYQNLIMYPFSAIQNILPFYPSDEKYRNIYWLHWATKDLIEFNDYKGHWPEFIAKRLLLPPEGVCDKFGAMIKPMAILKFKLERINNNLRETRDLLLPKLMSGEIKV